MKRTIFVVLMLAVPAMSCGPVSKAGMVLKYDFKAQPGNQSSQSATFVSSSATASDLTRGSGLTASAGTDSMNSKNFTTSSSHDANDYYTFTITPKAGQLMTLSELRFAERRSGTGIRKIEIRTSVDSYATVNGGVIDVPDNSSFRDQLVTLGGLTHLSTSLTLRIYAYAAEGNTGTWRLANHGTSGGLTLDGSFNSVPEPSSLTIGICLAAGGGAARRFRRGRRRRAKTM